MIKPSYERIKFLQNQLRTAIKNHHVLLLKSRLSPQDTEIKNQMNILQSLIISMGRTQNDLLEQLERELENNVVAKAEVGRHLSWFIPKTVPIYNKPITKSDSSKSDEHASVVSPRLIAPKPSPRVYSRTHSLIKPKDETDVLAKVDDSTSLWKNPKKLQSILKSKLNDPSKGFVRIQSESTKICGDTISEVTDDNIDLEPSSKRCKTTDSDPNSRSSSVSPKPMAAPKSHEFTRRKIVESKLWTRGKKRLAVEAATAAAKAASFSGNSEKDINDLEESLKNEPIDPDVPTDEKILENLSTYEEMGKVKFLETFRLISMSERDALKAKKAGRKRRTAAGQSNFYNDYFQHSALSMKNPKWRYEMQPLKRAPRDPGKRTTSILDGVRRVSSPPEVLTSGEVTPEDKASPPRELVPPLLLNVCEASCDTRELEETIAAKLKDKIETSEKTEEENDVGEGTASQNSIVVEATELEEDEEKEKDKLCVICRSQGDDCSLEICIVCNEKYHLNCATPESEGRCNLCFAQVSGFKAMVGGDTGVSSSSSLEVIKRYLTI